MKCTELQVYDGSSMDQLTSLFRPMRASPRPTAATEEGSGQVEYRNALSSTASPQSLDYTADVPTKS